MSSSTRPYPTVSAVFSGIIWVIVTAWRAIIGN